MCKFRWSSPLLAVLLLLQPLPNRSADAWPFSAPPADPPPAKPAVIEVMADGLGPSVDAARKDACRAAVAQVVGLLVVASDQVKNEKLIDSKVLTYSDGFVESFDPVGQPETSDGTVHVKLKVRVRRGKLTKVLSDNAIPVKEVDLKGVQAQSETLETQAQTASEIMKELFHGFPASVLKVETLKAVRVSGDSEESIIEIPVRVQVDPAKWKAWVAQAKRLLDPLAESKGTENWNVRMAGWTPLRKSAGESKPKDEPSNEAAKQIAKFAKENPWGLRFVPDSERKGAAVRWKLDTPDRTAAARGRPSPKDATMPAIISDEDHVIAILDSLDGKLCWWKLPADTYATFLKEACWPTVELRIETADGSGIGTAMADWTESVTDAPPTEGKRKSGNSHREGRVVLEEKDGVGRPTLAVGSPFTLGNSDHSFAIFGCVALERNGGSALLLPCGSVGQGYMICHAPSMVFPRRFRVPANEIPAVETAKVSAVLSASQEPLLPAPRSRR